MLEDERIARMVRNLERRISENEDSGLDDKTVYPIFAVSDGVGVGDSASLAVTNLGFTVDTDGSSNIGDNSATLEGTLVELDDAASADVNFEYRETGASSFQATTLQTLSSEQAYTEDVTGLSAGTDYEFRANGEASDGDTDTGVLLTFTTTGSANVIENFEDNDLSNYTGDTDGFTIQTGTVIGGTYTLEADTGDEFGAIQTQTDVNTPSLGDITTSKAQLGSSTRIDAITFDESGGNEIAPSLNTRFDPKIGIRTTDASPNSLIVASNDALPIDEELTVTLKTTTDNSGDSSEIVAEMTVEDSGGTQIARLVCVVNTLTPDTVKFNARTTTGLAYADDLEISGTTSSIPELTGNLSTWYRLQEGVGTTAYDAYKGANPGSINGASWSTDSKVGSAALSGDGTDDNVDTGITSLSTPFSYCLWVKPDLINSSASPRAFGNSSNGSDDVYLWDDAGQDNGWRSIVDPVDNLTGGDGTVDDNSWQHMAVTVDSTDHILYKNGSQLASGNGGSFTVNSGNTFKLFELGDNSRYLAGLIDDFRFYDAALSATQVSDIYNNTV